MPLTEEQRNRALMMGGDGWAEDADLERYLAEVTNCEELHVMAGKMTDEDYWPNSSVGEVLMRIIEHPLCDIGTALMIYWRTGPHHWAEYTEPIFGSGHNEETMADLLASIQHRVREGAYAGSAIAYDPYSDKACGCVHPGSAPPWMLPDTNSTEA